MNLFKWGVNVVLLLRKYGIQVDPEHELLPKGTVNEKKEFIEQARNIYNHHLKQTRETVLLLRKKYEKPVYGQVRIWDLLKLLAQCIAPSDTSLFGVSQLVHCLQVVEAMECDGITNQDMIVAGLIHDLGKILLLMEEPAENVVCLNTPIGSFEKGIGLDNCVFQWNHEEFIYSRLKDYLPKNLAWLIRYHGIYIPFTRHLMNERDKEYTEHYLHIFQKYDKGTKSIYRLPKKRLDQYRDLIENYFPRPIIF